MPVLYWFFRQGKRMPAQTLFDRFNCSTTQGASECIQMLVGADVDLAVQQCRRGGDSFLEIVASENLQLIAGFKNGNDTAHRRGEDLAVTGDERGVVRSAGAEP